MLTATNKHVFVACLMAAWTASESDANINDVVVDVQSIFI